tara:strand:- start:8882 stop:9079 length:198 start_codon:yes stop_codon:yes gene_type:complete
MNSPSIGSHPNEKEAEQFLFDYTRNPENWLQDRIAEDIPGPGEGATQGKVRNDMFGKVQRGILRV